MGITIKGGVRALSGVLKLRHNLPPVWDTAVGSLGTINTLTAVNFSVQATDPLEEVVTYLFKNGTLPTGSSLNLNTGDITGPAVATPATFNFTITATDGFARVSRSFSIDIIA